jgi:activator of HSP90 ATPase
MKSLNQTYHIDASVDDVFDALTVPEIMEEWSGAKASMDPVPGGEFSLWGGDIHGKNLEISRHRIVQEWFGGDWDEPSIVTFDIIQSPEGTIVELKQERIPDEDYHAIEEGWEKYYLGQIQGLFEEEEED